MKPVGVVRFPGTNCDRDIMSWMKAKEFQAEILWHLDIFSVKDFEMIILPGGFSFGDYLRSGALAALSPVMKSVREFAQLGGPVLGICNGFQILCEAGLLPGALVKNENRRFIDDWAELEVISTSQKFGAGFQRNQTLRLPIAHGDGKYYNRPEEIRHLSDQGQVWLRYKNNPNGSSNDIAGVTNKLGNVAGLMPHPERALFSWMGGADGWNFL